MHYFPYKNSVQKLKKKKKQERHFPGYFVLFFFLQFTAWADNIRLTATAAIDSLC